MFKGVLEEVFRSFDWEGKGININGEMTSHLRFADNVVLIAKECKELKEMAKEFVEKSRIAGLTINQSQTRLITNETGRGKFKLGSG